MDMQKVYAKLNHFARSHINTILYNGKE